jgi:tetratricopeptide (TPR) repeat protein
MLQPSLKKILNNAIWIPAFILSIFVTLPVQTAASAEGKNSRSSLKKEEELTQLQREARFYRQQGLGAQRLGNLDEAISFYKKAVLCDPAYPVVHNDLGVIYEIKGLPGAAEESYLKAIQIDPLYLSAYSNLALLYESKHRLDKAAVYWQKRVELSSTSDPWTRKARERLEDIRLVSGDKTPPLSREQEIFSFSAEVAAAKAGPLSENLMPVEKSNMVRARQYFENAQASYARGDGVTALKEALEAQQCDPTNKRVLTFIEELQRKLLSR